MGIKIKWLLMIPLLAHACWAEADVTAQLVPAEVRPGEVFEMRVAMKANEYARFKLEVPVVKGLHRVAIEPQALEFRSGSYHQAETWIMQADHSGEFTIDGLKVTLERKNGESVLELHSLLLKVLPYASNDHSEEPMAFPTGDEPSRRGISIWWALLPSIGIVAILCFRWFRRDPVAAEEPKESEASVVMAALRDGRIPSSELELLLDKEGGLWSADLREGVEQALYAGRADPGILLDAMEKEGLR